MHGSSMIGPQIKPPHPLLLALENRSVAEYGFFLICRSMQCFLPRGDGHPVLIVPGFVQNTSSVVPLREVLRRLGYEAHTWDQGRNLGFSKDALASLRAQGQSLVD